MSSITRSEAPLLLAGDAFVFYVSLWVTLFLRYLSLPTGDILGPHLLPFTILFAVWILVYFIAGLYDRHTVLFKKRLPSVILRTQVINVALAALFFFLIPYFGITPKTILVIYLAVSSVLLLVWRLYLSFMVGVRTPENAVMIGRGVEVDELVREINANPRYNMRFVHRFAPEEVAHSDALQEQILAFLDEKGITMIVANTRDEEMKKLLPVLYRLLYLRKEFAFTDTTRLYESIFRRVPLSMLNYDWFLEHITSRSRVLYDLLHRLIDVVGALLLGIPTLLLLPLVALAIKLDDGGPLFSFQTRVGKYNEPLQLVKFRTMTVANDDGVWGGTVENRVTKVGAFLRKSRIDELPQLWNVLHGGYSLIGPRPEFAPAVASYERQIPYYTARHLITPGLSGWAQIYHEQHPHHGVDIDETKNKLSYDLYYIKNRSFSLDIEIFLKTIRALLERGGA